MRLPLPSRPALVWSLVMSAACGRLGFEAHGPHLVAHGADAPPGAPASSGDAQVADVLLDRDAGSLGADAAPASGDADASVSADAGLPTGPGMPPDPSAPLDCAQFPSALACASFSANELPANATPDAADGEARVLGESFVATTTAARGHASLIFDIPPHATGALYLRMLVHVPSGFAIDAFNLAAFSNIDTTEDVDVDLLATQIELFFGPDGTSTVHAYVFPRDQWLCLSAQLDIDDVDGALTVRLPDASFSTSARDTLPGDAVEQVRLGIDWSSSSQEPAEVRIDDVLIADTELLGCP